MSPTAPSTSHTSPARRVLSASVLAAAALVPGAVFAHGGEGLTARLAWSAWSLTPEISGPMLLIVIIYVRGALRRRSVAQPPSAARHALFLAGMLALFLSLQSPIDPMGERMFVMHQIQHFLLRMVGPMLIMLSHPQGVLVAGLPDRVRRTLLAPMMRSGALSATFDLFTRPVVAFVLFVLSLYFWQVPSVHNAALLDPMIHWLMHLTMLAAGLLFFAMIFDHRDVPSAPPHFLRILLLFATILANIFLGAITVFKTDVLYTAYDIEGRLFGIAPLSDETIGGLILWVPASMMSVVAILVVVYDWNRTEAKRVRRGHGHAGPRHASAEAWNQNEGRARAVGPSTRFGLLLGLLAVTMFGLVIGTGVFVVSLG